MNFHGKTCLVLGLAREGIALARFLADAGARVVVTDSAKNPAGFAELHGLAGIQAYLGDDFPELVQDVDVVYVSPGVPESNAVYVRAIESGVPVASMTTLFFELCPGRITAITGSSGKTTTTGLIGHILATAQRDVVVGGNIGTPMLELLPSIGRDTDVILELSSFQLALLRKSPQVAVVTNFSPNHLDRHGSMENYLGAKLQIVAHQSVSDFVVLNSGDPWCSRFLDATPAHAVFFGWELEGPGVSVRDGALGLNEGPRFTPVMPTSDVPLIGRHNVENVMAACAATSLLSIQPSDMAAAIGTYRPPRHRLETVARRAGVRFIDDSVATSPARALVALDAIDEPVLLIAGGRDKRLPWEQFAARVASRVSALFLIGEAADDIERAVRRQLAKPDAALSTEAVYRCESLDAAVTMAQRLAQPGDVVLLSPACASYDMFVNFEERGNVFARAVEAVDAA